MFISNMLRRANKNDNVVSSTIPLQLLVYNAVGITDFDWKSYLKNLILPEEAYANSVPGRFTQASSSDVLIPSGSCYRITYKDDVPGDGLIPSADICAFYSSYFFGHFFPMISHMRRNMAQYSSGNTRSVADCMTNFNPGSPHRKPVDFDVEYICRVLRCQVVVPVLQDVQ